jgi:WD40 repeat protein
MARISRGRASSIAYSLTLALTVLSPFVANADLYEKPVLIIDPGLHTAQVNSISVDKAGKLAVTGGADKTVRIWAPADGRLLRTVRIPSGSGNVGKIYAVAIQPSGALIAAAGWTNDLSTKKDEFIYIIEAQTGQIIKTIPGLAEAAVSLAFSPDGRFLAAGLGEKGGLHIYDSIRDWTEVAKDLECKNSLYGLSFAGDGRLAVESLDGELRIYNREFKRISRDDFGSGLMGVAFAPDGSKFAVGNLRFPIVAVLDPRTLKTVASPEVPGNKGNLNHVTWSRMEVHCMRPVAMVIPRVWW